MYMMVIKASVLIVVIIAVLGVLQAQPATDLMIVFVAAGVVPGVGLVVPAQVILVTVAMAFMLIAALVFRAQARHRVAMQALVQANEQDQGRQDPSYTALVPGLAQVLAAGRAFKLYIRRSAPDLYLWLRRVGQQLRARAPAVNGDLRAAAVKIDRWTTGRVIRACRITRKWRSFVLRVTTF